MIDVAAAVISDEYGRVLICRRQSGGDCGGMWEFPGGKREAGETMEQALVRECREELSAEIKIESLYADFIYAYPQRTIHFCFYKARLLSVKICMNVHNDWKWADAAKLHEFQFCPADEKLIRQIVQENS